MAADNRDLNYDKYVVKGQVHTMADESYTSHNTNRLDVEGTVKKILTTDYVQGSAGELGGGESMNILVTGSKGMVGTALVNNLKNIRDGKNRTRPNIHIDNIYSYDLDSTAGAAGRLLHGLRLRVQPRRA